MCIIVMGDSALYSCEIIIEIKVLITWIDKKILILLKKKAIPRSRL